jgi:hypothetical protein
VDAGELDAQDADEENPPDGDGPAAADVDEPDAD